MITERERLVLNIRKRIYNTSKGRFGIPCKGNIFILLTPDGYSSNRYFSPGNSGRASKYHYITVHWPCCPYIDEISTIWSPRSGLLMIKITEHPPALQAELLTKIKNGFYVHKQVINKQKPWKEACRETQIVKKIENHHLTKMSRFQSTSDCIMSTSMSTRWWYQASLENDTLTDSNWQHTLSHQSCSRLIFTKPNSVSLVIGNGLGSCKEKDGKKILNIGKTSTVKRF